MQLTGGNFIGIALSAIQMSAGFLIIGQPIIKGSFLIASLITFIGMALAVLIERLSLGGLSAVRVARAHCKGLEDSFYLIETPTERQVEQFETRKKSFGSDGRIGWVFGGLGMVLSASVGDVFWHFLFAPLQPEWLGVAMSLACAAVIGLTFVHSELYKLLMDGVLKEILADMSVMKTAVAVEEQSMQLDMMVDAYEAVQSDESVREPAEDRIRKTIGRRLTGFANQISAAADQVQAINSVTVVDSSFGSNPQLALPAPRGKYHLHKEELLRLLRANAQLSQRDIAQHFNISRSTANEWYRRLKAGV